MGNTQKTDFNETRCSGCGQRVPINSAGNIVAHHYKFGDVRHGKTHCTGSGKNAEIYGSR